MTITERDFVNVPPGTVAPPGAGKWNAETMNEWQAFLIEEVQAHLDSTMQVHGGVIWWVSASTAPPANPPNGLPWYRTDTQERVVNIGTPSVPVWDVLFSDPYKLTASDLVTDYVVAGLLPPVPSNSLSLAIPSGAAIVAGRRVAKGSTTSHNVPARKSTFVDLSSAGVFTNVDNGVLLDDGEDVWGEKTDSDFTQSIVAGGYSVGNALRFAIASGASAGDFVTEAIPAVDLSVYGKLKVRIRSSIALTSGQLQILLDNSPQCASPVQTLDVPALAANTWTEVSIPYDNGAAGISSIISLGLKYTVDVGACNIDIEDVWAVKTTEPAVTASSIRLFEARADADISQIELVDITSAANSTVYTVRINGVDVTYTSDASATEGEIALGLVAALNASANPAVTPITASTTAIAADTSATLLISADVPGVAFTILVGANLTSSNQVPNSVSNVVSVTDRRTLDPTLRGAGSHNFWGSIHPDVDATDTPANGEVVTYDSTASKWKSSPLPASSGGLPYTGQSGASALFAAYGDADPGLASLMQAVAPGLSNSSFQAANLGTTTARMVKFRLPKNLSVAHVWTWPVGATTNVFRFGIYNASTGALVWDSGTFTTVASAWLDLTANTPFSLAANTDYWFVVACTSAPATTVWNTIPIYGGTAFWGANAAPLGGRSLGIPNMAKITVTGGALPSTLPAISAESGGNGVPFAWLEGTAS